MMDCRVEPGNDGGWFSADHREIGLVFLGKRDHAE
jgi:hypothetical protein